MSTTSAGSGVVSSVTLAVSTCEGTTVVCTGEQLLSWTCDGKCGDGMLRGACMVSEGDVKRRRNLRFRFDTLPEPSIFTK